MGNKQTTPIGGLRTAPDTGRITPPETIPKNAPRDTQPIAIPATVRDTATTQPLSSADSDDDFELPIIVEEDPTHTIYTQFMDMVYSGEPSTDLILAELFHRWKTGEITAEDSPEVIKTLYDAIQKESEKKHTEPPRTKTKEASPSPTILQPFDYHIALAKIPDATETVPDIETEYIVPGVFEIAATTSQGGEGSKIRHNEDAIYTTRTEDGTIIAAVIDGAGGSGSKTKSSITHPGYVASEIAIGSLTDLTRQYTSLKDIIREVSERISNNEAWKNETDPNKRGYACGAMARITETGDIELASAGDTRALLFSHTGEKKAATQMQNIATYYAQGNTEAALTDTAHLSQITRGLGISLPAGTLPPEYTDISYRQTTCNTGDIVLLCSDGVGDVVTETELSQLVAQHASDTKALRDAIMQLALQRNNLPANTSFEVQIADGTLQKMKKRGMGDNITVQVIRVIKPNLSEGIRQMRKIIQETAAETAITQTPKKPTEPAVFATADTIPWSTAQRSTPEDRPPQQFLRPNTAQVPKPSAFKRAARWLGGIAAAGLAAFGLHLASDRNANNVEQTPEATSANTTTEQTARQNEIVFDVSEVEPFTETSSNAMVFDESEVERYDTAPTQETATPVQTVDNGMISEETDVGHFGTTEPTQATQHILDTAIDQETTTSTLTEMIQQTLTRALGSQTAHDVMTSAQGAIERYNESIRRGRWSDAMTSRGQIIDTIRSAQEHAPAPTLTPEREVAPIEIVLDTQYIGHGEGQSGTVWEALAHVGELPLRHADGTPYWSDERAFHSWRNAQLTEMNNPRLVHSGDRIETYIDSQDNLHARLIRSSEHSASLASLPTESDIEDAFTQIAPSTRTETQSETPQTFDIEDDEDIEDIEEEVERIVVAGQTITEGGTIEIRSRSGNTIQYRVLDIIQGDGSPDRITLQSIDGRNNKTFKYIHILEQNPEQFRVITP